MENSNWKPKQQTSMTPANDAEVSRLIGNGCSITSIVYSHMDALKRLRQNKDVFLKPNIVEYRKFINHICDEWETRLDEETDKVEHVTGNFKY